MNYVKEKVSIVMPTYNVSEFLEETVNSVINQSYSNWELIVVDDCSNDDTPELIKKLAEVDSRIRYYLSSKNQGAGITRNKALSLATGQYIAFLDSDDLWYADKLSQQLSFMAEHNAPICHTSYEYIDEKGACFSGRVQASHSVDLLSNLKNTEIGTSTAIIDRAIVVEPIAFKPLRARQDLRLWIDLLGNGHKSFGLNRVLVKYRVRGGSVSSNKLKMLVVTFRVYLGISQLSISSRLTSYISYVINAIKKRT
ncbi:glycosyltransferase family 2 protein [Vibrio alginolyticus]|uniref:glycosyltransferase family 2 protein n=1 Tax=Vibrio sp. B1FLJ16 TaxID=2751178 RepID=UPI0015F579FB|nr:glycosyltransferase family 2 protein [Vibrio sp. B1FLJ16]CAD7797747.1 PFAM glycosyl transferase family 2 [Vibrio sp. B1FLJ16]CAE6880862.1 PFAM glycosyl transferase family 2 [Vibrio sp. B1FLJ16]